MKLLNAKQVAKRLNVHVETVRLWVRRDKIPSIRAGRAGSMKFDWDAVLARLSMNNTTNTSN